MSWMEVDGAGYRWLEVDGAGWRWAHGSVIPIKKHKIDFSKKFEYCCTYFHLVNL